MIDLIELILILKFSHSKFGTFDSSDAKNGRRELSPATTATLEQRDANVVFIFIVSSIYIKASTVAPVTALS